MAADTEKTSQWPGEIAHGAGVDLSDLKWLTLLPSPQIGPQELTGTSAAASHCAPPLCFHLTTNEDSSTSLAPSSLPSCPLPVTSPSEGRTVPLDLAFPFTSHPAPFPMLQPCCFQSPPSFP